VAIVVGVVEKVLLELVEDDQQVGAEAQRPPMKGFSELCGCALRLFGLPTHRRRDRLVNTAGQRGDRFVRPAVEVDDDELRRARTGDFALRRFPQFVGDTSTQQGGLPNPAGAVQQCEPRRHHVRDDDVALGLPTEEQWSVLLGVGGQAAVRRLRHQQRL
jgi:hypothetical protein